MLRKISVFAATMFASTAALAADDLYYTPGPNLAPDATYVYDWSGTRVGFHGGLTWGETDSDFALTTGATGTVPFDQDGGEVGIHVGHNWQNDTVVLGIGAEATWLDIDGSSGIAGGAVHSLDTSFLLDATARAGIAIDQFQPYLVGGLSLLDYDYTLTHPASGASETHDDTAFGGTLGAGLEVAASNEVSLFGEYRHYWFDGDSNAFVGPGGVTAQSVDPDIDIDTVRGGINWRF
jgi:outer membrane immunogenic protein